MPTSIRHSTHRYRHASSFPSHWIGGDISPDTVKVGIIADNVFVIIALPQKLPAGSPQRVSLSGHGGLEPANNRSKRMRGRTKSAGCGNLGALRDHNHRVEMIRHHHESIKADVWAH